MEFLATSLAAALAQRQVHVWEGERGLEIHFLLSGRRREPLSLIVRNRVQVESEKILAQK